MAAGTKDINVEQGASFRMSLTWTAPGTRTPDGVLVPGAPYDLTGAHARMQIRKGPGQPVLVDLRDGDGITLGGTTGRIEIYISPERTEALATKRARYDVFIVLPNGLDVARVLKGRVTVDYAITDDDDTP